MLTLFCTPKPFLGHTGIIQRNALESWRRLAPAPEILVFGNDAGVAEACADLGLSHIPDPSCNASGTPLLDDLFGRAQSLGRGDLLCYANADIILMEDFARAVAQLSTLQKPFLTVGQRWDLEVPEALEFTEGWAARLRERAFRNGVLHPRTGIDYFLFPKGLWKSIPPFAVGRPVWDNWMLYDVRRRGIPLIDATGEVTAVHQNHGYAHRPGGEGEVLYGPEAARNRELAGEGFSICTLDHATHVLTPSGPRLALDPSRLRGRLDAWYWAHPPLRLPLRALMWTWAGGKRLLPS